MACNVDKPVKILGGRGKLNRNPVQPYDWFQRDSIARTAL